MCISTTGLEWMSFSYFGHFLYMRAMGLHQAVALCMFHYDAAELTNDNAWFVFGEIVLELAEDILIVFILVGWNYIFYVCS